MGIIDILHDAGYTDTELAEVANVSREHINRIRNGKKPLTALTESLLQEFAESSNIQVREAQYENVEYDNTGNTEGNTPFISYKSILAFIAVLSVIALIVLVTRYKHKEKHL